jgi:hypothetical protein
MAVINRNTLVLTGVSVVRDVVTVAMGNGLNSACALLSVKPISTRHPSQRYPQAEQTTGQRHDHAEISGVDQAACRAGRPGCREGFLARRGLALPASLTAGGSSPTAATQLGRIMAECMASAGMRLPGRLLPSFAKALRRRSLPRLAAKQGSKQTRAELAWRQPAGGALSASTRG